MEDIQFYRHSKNIMLGFTSSDNLIDSVKTQELFHSDSLY